MSKGLGAVQRALLAVIQEHRSIDTYEACWRAYKIEMTVHEGEEARWFTDAQYASARRALAGLAKQGLIVNQGAGWRYGRGRWCTPEYALAHPDEVHAPKGSSRETQEVGCSPRRPGSVFLNEGT
jgi:hypothetical protein